MPASLGSSTPLTDHEPTEASTCSCVKPPDDLPCRNLVVYFSGAHMNVHVKQHLLDRLETSNRQLTWLVPDHQPEPRAKPDTWSLRCKGALNLADLAEPWDIKEGILMAYRWLDGRFQDGDRIFLFGYGRGALQVQVVAGMLQKAGCGRKWGDDVEKAFELYRGITSSDGVASNGGPENGQKQAEHDVKAHYIGIWPLWEVERDLFKSRLCCSGTMSDLACAFRRALVLDQDHPGLTFAPRQNYCWVPDDVVDQSAVELWCLNTSNSVEDLDTESLGPIIREYSNFSSFWIAQEAGNMGLALKQYSETVWERNDSGENNGPGYRSYRREHQSLADKSTAPQAVQVVLNVVGVSPLSDSISDKETERDGSSTGRHESYFTCSASSLTTNVHLVDEVVQRFPPERGLYGGMTQINMFTSSSSV